MLRHLCLLPSLLFFPFIASASTFVMGQHLPLAVIIDDGVIHYSGGEFSYQPWNSATLTGKVRVVLHLAGRLSAKEENASLTEKLQAANLPRERFQTTLIVNTQDAIPGSALFVRASLKSSKKQSPWSQFIIDNSGEARRTWQLKEGGSAVVVLDKSGNIRFYKEGALSPLEVNHVISLLSTLLS
ncbi:YtfJ family protein [Erwinia sp. MMLR14_017]|uniref:YtfJ family protein n=1 Tax=Erwinia sp. MMLR14_017 TaxID=3093842 RepID=UPI00298F59F4|nr:YtfJ family protein [Erwinia sp. MMLR14_017]MDW8846007.1 YtfJ family protein [Erwinia sp. MMLR14_017]